MQFQVLTFLLVVLVACCVARPQNEEAKDEPSAIQEEIPTDEDISGRQFGIRRPFRFNRRPFGFGYPYGYPYGYYPGLQVGLVIG